MLSRNVNIPRRSNIEIAAEILRIAKKGARKTRIVYGANINFKLLEEYLNKLERAGLIAHNIEENAIIQTTEKGVKCLQYYEGFKNFEII
jgi:predicted transcriptional regulator